MTDPLRLVMIGAGRHASQNIYPCFRLLQGAEVVANADLDLVRAKSAARSVGIPSSYDNYRTMLAQERPDGVLICVGPDFHATVAIELMRSGHHVYTEKPPALNLNQCREVAVVQAETGRICMTAFKKRFAPAGQRLKETVDNQRFGAPTVMSVLRSWQRPEGDLEACRWYLRDSMVHMFDLACWLFGPALNARTLRCGNSDTTIQVAFVNGASACMAYPTTTGSKRVFEEITVTGSGGVLARMSNATEFDAWHDGEPIGAYRPEWSFGSRNSSTEMGFVPELQAFVDALRSNTQPISAIATVLPGVALMEAAMNSLGTAEAVMVEAI